MDLSKTPRCGSSWYGPSGIEAKTASRAKGDYSPDPREAISRNVEMINNRYMFGQHTSDNADTEPFPK